jgi:hypothetical protein
MFRPAFLVGSAPNRRAVLPQASVVKGRWGSSDSVVTDHSPILIG